MSGAPKKAPAGHPASRRDQALEQRTETGPEVGDLGCLPDLPEPRLLTLGRSWPLLRATTSQGHRDGKARMLQGPPR